MNKMIHDTLGFVVGLGVWTAVLFQGILVALGAWKACMAGGLTVFHLMTL